MTKKTRRSTDCSAGSATATISATAATVTLAATSSSEHQLQARRSHVQDPQQINSSLPQPSCIRPQESTRHLRSSVIPLLYRLTNRTHFADRTFQCSAPATWNLLNMLSSSSLALFKRSLKTFLFHQAFRLSSNCIAPL